MRAAFETAAGNPENQDRAAALEISARLVLVVADGAGGQSGGTKAASMALELVRQDACELRDINRCLTLLQRMDESIYGDRDAGETTCALAVVTEDTVYGASVGDSGVWVINERGFVNLTEGQSRKPLIGSGCARANPFEYRRTGKEMLMLATDGLLKYTASDRIIAICTSHEGLEVPIRLIELVRYPSGALPDDVTVIFAFE